jgi:hypothetical protein
VVTASPNAVVSELQRIVESMPPGDAPASRPPALERCAQLLRESVGEVEIASGPSHVIPRGTAFASAASVRTSGDDEAWRPRAPGGWGWRADEWEDLLDGKLGPWAMASVQDRAFAICHSARLADRGAEAGTWTHPDFRGQGHAAAVTAAWASLFDASDQVLFYSASATNISSQRVAARLNLPMIGWLWKLSAPGG